MGAKIGGEIEEGVIGFLPQTNLILLFGPRTTVQILSKSNKNCGRIGVRTDRKTDEQTDRQTDKHVIS